jgi:hypothetical protein
MSTVAEEAALRRKDLRSAPDNAREAGVTLPHSGCIPCTARVTANKPRRRVSRLAKR